MEKLIEQEIVRQTEKRLRDSLDCLDWIEILSTAINNRKTSWNENPVSEWRNASDEILFAAKKAFEKKNNIPSQWNFLEEPEKEAKKVEGGEK